ncbi:MAG TPA: hypothetical protein DCE41_36215 [Cytophagales bacterium]|nr:hypothetical protein [Cytophagales bacterium]HAA21761.1 hypothetical protein [Cytophagales bacterium]HAP60051.1 hypothetical protein [Cytophagales bacterium]
MAEREEVGEGCALCGLDRPLTYHHLIPKKNHSNKWFKKRFTRQEMQTRGIDVCQLCHSYLHSVLNEKELGREYNTREALLSHELIAKFVEFQKGRG